jgi:short-subunit dehydrogenase
MAIVSNRKFAVVTGASAGIGLELARQCVEHGQDVLICAEDAAIRTVASELGAGQEAAVEPLVADLATYQGVEGLARAIERGGRPVDALLLNAGIGVGGAFLDTPLEEELRMIALNVTSVVHLAKRVLPAMVARGQGRVLITASVASTAPAPYLAVYGATKAFVLSLAEALRVELADSGVTVTALQPGATDTDFFARAGMEDTKVAQSKKDDPAEVARAGFEAMMAGKESVIASSLKSKLQGLANEITPEAVKARVQAKQTRPGSGSKTRH